MNEDCRKTAAHILTKLLKAMYKEGVVNDKYLLTLSDCAAEYDLTFDVSTLTFIV